MRRRIRDVPAELGLVVETADGRFCGAVVAHGKAVVAGEPRTTVTLEDRHGRKREFPLLAGAFSIDGVVVNLLLPTVTPRAMQARTKTASGSYAVAASRAQVAKASQIWVEGVHDASLVERIWGDDLRVEAVVVQPLGGIDNLDTHIAQFAPGPARRVGVLVDHLVPGSKESRLVAGITNPYVFVTGHPYIDIWQAVKPSALGIAAWPDIPRGQDWKQGVCAALNVSDPQQMWRQVLGSVNSYADVDASLLRAVEQLIDFVTAPE